MSILKFFQSDFVNDYNCLEVSCFLLFVFSVLENVVYSKIVE